MWLDSSRVTSLYPPTRLKNVSYRMDLPSHLEHFGSSIFQKKLAAKKKKKEQLLGCVFVGVLFEHSPDVTFPSVNKVEGGGMNSMRAGTEEGGESHIVAGRLTSITQSFGVLLRRSPICSGHSMRLPSNNNAHRSHEVVKCDHFKPSPPPRFPAQF